MKIALIDRLKIFFLYFGLTEMFYFILILITTPDENYIFKSIPAIVIICTSLIITSILFLYWMIKVLYKATDAVLLLAFILIFFLCNFVFLVSSQDARSHLFYRLSPEIVFPVREFERIPIYILIQTFVLSLLPTEILLEYINIHSYFTSIGCDEKKTTNKTILNEIEALGFSFYSVTDEIRYKLLKSMWPFHSFSVEKWNDNIINRKSFLYDSYFKRRIGKFIKSKFKIIKILSIIILLCFEIIFLFSFHGFIIFIDLAFGSDFLLRFSSFERESYNKAKFDIEEQPVSSKRVSEYLFFFQRWENATCGYIVFTLLFGVYFDSVFFKTWRETVYGYPYMSFSCFLLLVGVCVLLIDLFYNFSKKSNAYKELEYEEIEKGNKNWMLLFAHQFINSCKSIHESTRIIKEKCGVEKTVLSLQLQSERLQYNSERCFNYAHALSNHDLTDVIDVVKLYYEVIADIEKFQPCENLWDKTNIEFDNDENDSYIITSNKEILHTIIFELFTNAIKFNHNPHPVNIVITKNEVLGDSTKAALSISFYNVILPEDKEKIQSLKKRIDDFWKWNEVTFAGDIQLGLVFVKSYAELINATFDFYIEHHNVFVASLTFQ